MERLGFVGLGVMGSRMARRLLDAGFAVTGYNRTQAKAQSLLDAGMGWADCPRAVAEASDVIFSMVTDTTALWAISEGPDGILAGLRPNTVYVDMSTVSPEASRAVASQVHKRGATMLDAPVSGSSITLEQGQLSFMVGGEADALERVRPYLTAIGPKVTHVGEQGLAVSMKIATNLSLAVQMLAFSEGVLLAEKSGIKREVAADVLFNSVIASPMVKYRGPYVVGKMPRDAWFNVGMMQKDMQLALDQGHTTGVMLPTTALVQQWLTMARGLGLDARDFGALFDVLASLSGLPPSPNH